MIDAGLPLVQCLEILALQQEHKNFQKILLQVRQDVEAGSTLAGCPSPRSPSMNASTPKSPIDSTVGSSTDSSASTLLYST